MSFFALPTLVPSTVTVGAALGSLQKLVGPELINRGQAAAINAIRVLIGPKLGDQVVAPFVRTQLTQQRGGVALGGVILTWWLSSHLFTATSDAMDVQYGIADGRTTMSRRFIALAFAFASVAIVSLTLGLMVVGPLIGDSQGLAHRLGLAPALAVTWSLIRWPLLLVILIGFLISLYRYSPSVRHPWRQCLPGALLGVVLWIGAAAAFRVYLAIGAGDPTGVRAADADVIIIGRTVGAVVATVVWTYFSSIAILVGAELNAELTRRRRPLPTETP